MDFIKENLVFMREFLQEFDATGSFCPTSKWAAMELIAPMLARAGGKRIIEVGPGTGSVTVHILDHMGPKDELVICELNPRFMRALKENIALHPGFIRNRERITFFEGPVQGLPTGSKFDVIICAIPFLNLPIEIIKEIFGKFAEISKPDTILTYYEYIGMRKLGKAVSAERRKRVQELEDFFASLSDEIAWTKKRIWRNVLPVTVFRVDRIPPDGLAA